MQNAQKYTWLLCLFPSSQFQEYASPYVFMVVQTLYAVLREFQKIYSWRNYHCIWCDKFITFQFKKASQGDMTISYAEEEMSLPCSKGSIHSCIVIISGVEKKPQPNLWDPVVTRQVLDMITEVLSFLAVRPWVSSHLNNKRLLVIFNGPAIFGHIKTLV